MSNKIILKSSDGESFEVDEAVVLECLTIKHMIKDECTDNRVPLQNVNSATLAKVLEYCKKHVEAAADAGSNENTELNTWDQDFVKVDQPVLFDLLRAANFLNIPGLIDLTSETVADMMKNMNAEEIRKQFHIKNDFTPEEEAEIRKENAWPF